MAVTWSFGLAGRKTDPSAPVGVFDSGVGGLSVLREIVAELPAERLIYVADSRHAPYGDRPEIFITRRARTIADFLIEQGAKAIVVACNTATGAAIAALREAHDLPIVGIEPAVKPAAAMTRTGVVGVLATSRTLGSAKFNRLIAEHRGHARVLATACPGLVERIETGDVQGPETRALVERYVRPLVSEGADTIVLGCTHYVWVIPLIQEIAGPSVAVIDPARPVARELARRLREGTASAQSSSNLRPVEFWTSGDPRLVTPVMSGLWGAKVTVASLPAELAGQPADSRQ